MLTRILVMTQSHEPKFNGTRFRHQELHLVDLERGKIYERISTKLLCSSGIGTMLSLGYNSVYIFGGTDSLDDHVNSCNEDVTTFYRGAARLKIEEDNGKISGQWCQIPKQVSNSGFTFPSYTVLEGKIYNFGSGQNFGCWQLLCPQVFDPTTNSWDSIPLPLEFQGCTVYRTVLPDPSANRIILHLEKGPHSSPSIVAFYPRLGHWKLIVDDFLDWRPLAAIADDVIYFYKRYFEQRKNPNLLRAYDLKNLKWLKVCWSKTVVDGWDITRLLHERFLELLSLGDNSFCLSSARFVPSNSGDDDNSKLRVNFFKFRSERTDSTISLVLLSAHSFILPCTSYVCLMVPLT